MVPTEENMLEIFSIQAILENNKFDQHPYIPCIIPASMSFSISASI